jgi:hypothetical protein
MEAFLDTATRSRTEDSCVDAAVEAWLALRPDASSAQGRVEVRAILVRLRLVGPAAGHAVSPAPVVEAIVQAFRQARTAGLHPDNCLAHAVDAWLRFHPHDDRTTGERRVAAILERRSQSPTV